MKLFLLLFTFALQAQAAEPAASKLIDEMEGVYKHRFENAFIVPGNPAGEQRYQAEDIIEIVRYGETQVYVRAKLAFFNGHSCGIAGIATYENGVFVYHDPENDIAGEPPCALQVALTGDAITLTDRPTPDSAATCRKYCGARGSLSKVSLPRSSRRPIRYLERLKSSRQYLHAIEQLREIESSPAARPR